MKENLASLRKERDTWKSIAEDRGKSLNAEMARFDSHKCSAPPKKDWITLALYTLMIFSFGGIIGNVTKPKPKPPEPVSQMEFQYVPYPSSTTIQGDLHTISYGEENIVTFFYDKNGNYIGKQERGGTLEVPALQEMAFELQSNNTDIANLKETIRLQQIQIDRYKNVRGCM